MPQLNDPVTVVVALGTSYNGVVTGISARPGDPTLTVEYITRTGATARATGALHPEESPTADYPYFYPGHHGSGPDPTPEPESEPEPDTPTVSQPVAGDLPPAEETPADPPPTTPNETPPDGGADEPDSGDGPIVFS